MQRAITAYIRHCKANGSIEDLVICSRLWSLEFSNYVRKYWFGEEITVPELAVGFQDTQNNPWEFNVSHIEVRDLCMDAASDPLAGIDSLPKYIQAVRVLIPFIIQTFQNNPLRLPTAVLGFRVLGVTSLDEVSWNNETLFSVSTEERFVREHATQCLANHPLFVFLHIALPRHLEVIPISQLCTFDNMDELVVVPQGSFEVTRVQAHPDFLGSFEVQCRFVPGITDYSLHDMVRGNDIVSLRQSLDPFFMNEQDTIGNTPAHLAIGNWEIMRLLLETGEVELNVGNWEGSTPFIKLFKTLPPTEWFLWSELLLTYGADPNQQNNNGESALSLARHLNALPEVLELLGSVET